MLIMTKSFVITTLVLNLVFLPRLELLYVGTHQVGVVGSPAALLNTIILALEGRFSIHVHDCQVPWDLARISNQRTDLASPRSGRNEGQYVRVVKTLSTG